MPLLKKLGSKTKTLTALPIKTTLLFIEAFFTSGWVKFCLTIFPFNRVMHWLGTTNTESSIEADNETLVLRRQIKTAIDLCRKYAPWRTECYTMSLTGRIMLKRRKLPSTLYVGFMKDEEGKYKGHAWLRANDIYISGFKESKGFTVNFRFS